MSEKDFYIQVYDKTERLYFSSFHKALEKLVNLEADCPEHLYKLCTTDDSRGDDEVAS